MSEESRKKMGLAGLGRHHSQKTKDKLSLLRQGEKNPMFGKHPSLETRKKMGLARLGEKNHFFGKHLSQEHKEKISLTMRGEKNYWLGRHHSQETKDKMSLSMRGKKHRSPSQEIRDKMSVAYRGEKNPWFGKHPSQETRKKIGLASRNRHVSQETKDKIRLALLGRHHSQETKDKLSNYIGPLSSQWRGGLSATPYTTDWTKTLRRSIRERDHYICQICSALQSDRAFCTHHINYDKKDCNPLNLITLCTPCHTKTNFNREYWTDFFKKKGLMKDG